MFLSITPEDNWLRSKHVVYSTIVYIVKYSLDLYVITQQDAYHKGTKVLLQLRKYVLNYIFIHN